MHITPKTKPTNHDVTFESYILRDSKFTIVISILIKCKICMEKLYNMHLETFSILLNSMG